MRMRNTLFVSVAVAGACLFTGWFCTAAPVLPRTGRVSNEIISLANVQQIAVSVKHRSQVLKDQGYEPKLAKKHIQQMLIERSYEISQDPAAPTLSIVILTESDPDDHPGVIGFTYHVSLEQNVLIERLDRRLYVPTYALVHGSLTATATLKADVEALLPTVIDHFHSRVQSANKQFGE